MWLLSLAAVLALAPPVPLPLPSANSSAPARAQEDAEKAAEPIGEGFAARAVGSLAGADGPLAGDAGIVTFEQLDEVLIWRDGRSPNGQAALRQYLELRTLRHLADQQGLKITEEALLARYEELDAQARTDGVPGGLSGFIESQGVEPAEFRRYLELSMIHAELTRRALGLAADKEPTADQQQLWLEDTLEERKYEEKPHPWSEGVVCVSGDLVIQRDEFGAHLRKQVSEQDRKEALYLILLERAVRARMPEVSGEGVSAALDRELARRRTEAEADPRYKGVTYEQLLDARGLSVESLRRDPAIVAAALAHEVVDRENDDEALRAAYDAEREYFDGLFGESVEVRLLFKNAVDREDDPLRPSFRRVEEEMRAMVEAIEGPEDFLRAVEIHSQDRATRENGGLIGRITSGMPGVPKPIRDAVFRALDGAAKAEGASVEGKIVGPIRLDNGVVLTMLSNRRPAPTWDGMRDNVHREMRRRFLEETLPRTSVLTYLDRN
ncbi:MAG: hypothetical protein AAGB93_18530 [Planctomycetota bacterium]